MVLAISTEVLLPFSGVILIESRVGSRSIQRRLHASPGRAAVSFVTCRKAATLLLVPAISWSASVSEGMKGMVSILL